MANDLDWSLRMANGTKPPEVVVVGSVNLDVVMKVRHFPAVGETITGATVLDALGGKGSNQAVAAARLGSSVAMVACLGEDVAGRAALTALREEGIDVTACRTTADRPTGRAAILVDGKGRNSIVVADGSNAALSPDDVARAESLIAGAAVVVCQMEIPLETVDAALRDARSFKTVSILNTAPALPIERLTSPPDVLVANRVEAEVLSGIGTGATAELAAELQRRYGSRTIVITDGEHGAVARHEDQVLTAAALAVDVKDTTGAGDGFVGGLAASLAAGMAMEGALARACAVGSLATERPGAMPSLPRGAEVDAAMGGRTGTTSRTTGAT